MQYSSESNIESQPLLADPTANTMEQHIQFTISVC